VLLAIAQLTVSQCQTPDQKDFTISEQWCLIGVSYRVFTRCSKRPALAPVFWIHLLEVCWTFAGSFKHPVNDTACHAWHYGAIHCPPHPSFPVPSRIGGWVNLAWWRNSMSDLWPRGPGFDSQSGC